MNVHPTAFNAGNHYNKYASRNLLEKRVVQGFFRNLHSLVNKTDARHIHEVGCGEGVLIASLQKLGRTLYGSDKSQEIINYARSAYANSRPVIDFECAAIEDLNPSRHAADLIICCEVLEHLVAPRTALTHLARLARPYIIFSVPREPMWRCLNMIRLRYIGQLGNTPGHLQHWSSKAFACLVNEQFRVIEIRRPLPWTMLLCRAN